MPANGANDWKRKHTLNNGAVDVEHQTFDESALKLIQESRPGDLVSEMGW